MLEDGLQTRLCQRRRNRHLQWVSCVGDNMGQKQMLRTFWQG